jgi:hypothetical protein
MLTLLVSYCSGDPQPNTPEVGSKHFSPPPKFTMDMKDKYAKIPDKPNYSEKKAKKKPREKVKMPASFGVEPDMFGNFEGGEEALAHARMKELHKTQQKLERDEAAMLDVEKRRMEQQEAEESKHIRQSRMEQRVLKLYIFPHNISIHVFMFCIIIIFGGKGSNTEGDEEKD